MNQKIKKACEYARTAVYDSLQSKEVKSEWMRLGHKEVLRRAAINQAKKPSTFYCLALPEDLIKLRQAAEYLDGKAGFSELERFILDNTLNRHNYGYGLSLPIYFYGDIDKMIQEVQERYDTLINGARVAGTEERVHRHQYVWINTKKHLSAVLTQKIVEEVQRYFRTQRGEAFSHFHISAQKPKAGTAYTEVIATGESLYASLTNTDEEAPRRKKHFETTVVALLNTQKPASIRKEIPALETKTEINYTLNVLSAYEALNTNEKQMVETWILNDYYETSPLDFAMAHGVTLSGLGQLDEGFGNPELEDSIWINTVNLKTQKSLLGSFILPVSEEQFVEKVSFIIAHELGHALGIMHNYQDSCKIMSISSSICRAGNLRFTIGEQMYLEALFHPEKTEE